MLTLWALLPPTLVLVLMLLLRRRSFSAGVAGWLTALLVARWSFGAGWELLFWAQVRGLFTAASILTVIWGALLFYRATEASGTIEALVTHLRRLSPHREVQVLVLAWGFASFLQGVGGFGVPMAIVAPLMVVMGFDALTAVLLPALGHAWAIPFGSLGASFLALSSVVPVEEAKLAPWCAGALALLALLGGWAVLRASGGSLRRAWPLWPMMGLVMGGVQLVAAVLGLWNVASLLGALAGLGMTFLIVGKGEEEESPLTPLLPYAILLLLVFALRFFPPLRALFDAVMLRVMVPELRTSLGWTMAAGPTRALSLFGNTGALLLYASLVTLWLGWRWGRLDLPRLREVGALFLRGALRASGGLVMMVLLAATMEGAGMIDLLARSLAAPADGLFAPLAPALGALIAFVTGSSMASNLLVGALQARTASLLHLNLGVILAAQAAGSAIGSVLSPAKMIVGCSTVGMGGREGEVMRVLARYFFPWLLLLALLSWLLA